MTKNPEERVAEIMEECGFIKNFLKEMDINYEIRELEELAKAHRPATARKTERLTKFLPIDKAKRLEELRKEKLRLIDVQERGIVCAKERISAEDIRLIKTEKGIYAQKKKETGLEVLFG